MLLLIVLQVVQATLQFHYNFAGSYGQGFPDLSGNGNIGLSGTDATVNSNDVTPTARGAYFSGNSRVTAPPNAAVTTGMSTGSSFSMSCWIISFATRNVLFEKGSLPTLIWRFNYVSSVNFLRFRLLVGGVLNYADGTVDMPLNVWTYVTTTVQCTTFCTVLGYSGLTQLINHTTAPGLYVDSPTDIVTLGNQATGIMYDFQFYSYVLSLTGISNGFLSPGSGGCSASCSSLCVVYPTTICLCTSRNPLVTLDCSTPCTCGSFGCAGNDPTACEECNDSCVYLMCTGQSYLDCSMGQICYSTCATCSGSASNQCLSCVDPNAVVVAGVCSCESGFYQSSLSPVTCTACYYTCATCTTPAANMCITCADPNASVSSGVCACKAGYYQSSSSPFTCTLCGGPCDTCTSEAANNCVACKSGAFLSGPPPAVCICNPGFYPSPDLSQCSPCANTCASCDSSVQCLSCKANAELIVAQCVCIIGYYGFPDPSNCIACSERCVNCDPSGCLQCAPGFLTYLSTCVLTCPNDYKPNNFSVCIEKDMVPPTPSQTVTSDNNLLVEFNKGMIFTDVSAADISVDVLLLDNTTNAVSWSTPSFLGSESMSVNLTFESSYLPTGSRANLSFLDASKFTNKDGVAISVLSVTGALNSFGTPPRNASSLLTAPAAQQTAVAVEGGAAVLLVSSLLSGNPQSLIIMISQLQLISYIAMTQVNLTTDFGSTLAALNMGSIVSNYLQGRTQTNEASQMTTGFVANYGVPTTLFLSNASGFIGTSLVILISYIPIYLLSRVKNKKVATYFAGKLPSLMWRVPINLWITSYLDLGVFSCLQLGNLMGSHSDVYETVNLVSAFLFCIFLSATPVLLYVFIIRNKQLMLSRTDPGFNKRWGVLFKEFKQDNRVTSITYYSLFITRRFIFFLTLSILQDSPAHILAINLATALSVCVTQAFIYDSAYRPFASRLDQVLGTVNDGCTMIIYGVVGLFLFDLDLPTLSFIGAVGMWIVRGVVFFNVLISTINIGIMVVALLQEFRQVLKTQNRAQTIRDGKQAQELVRTNDRRRIWFV